jgi:Delta7-sterol 5-desaturase
MQAWISSATFLELSLAVLAVTVVLTAMGLAMGYAAEAYYANRKIFDVPRKRGLLRTEIIGTVLFHVLFVPPTAQALAAGWIRFEGTGLLAAILSAALPWAAFQVLYYFFHRALHSRSLFFAHRWHHESLVTSPMTGLSMSPFEAAGWVVMLLGPAMALTAAGLLSPVGYAFFFGNFWVGNIAGHANVDFFPMRISRAVATFVPPITYHCLHHARFDGHYGFASAYLDRWLGTEWNDWKVLHDQAYDGTPMTSLKQKGTPAIPTADTA